MYSKLFSGMRKSAMVTGCQAPHHCENNHRDTFSSICFVSFVQKEYYYIVSLINQCSVLPYLVLFLFDNNVVIHVVIIYNISQTFSF